ncbi:MAG: type II toxin-antitoxin system RelE/ParE family toxin [Candidatus Gracilibacteria bacterium]|nr:type II toxin-antitoxin system RelE/ParE family toxin [Candidatus Gracilibacteria bacterium]
MDQIQKQWQKIPEKDRAKIRQALEKLKARDFQSLPRKKLKGYDHIFRIRVGQYRLIYFDDGKEILLKYLKRKNERTYREV